MHYTITYQDVLPPYVFHHQNIEADSIQEAKKRFHELHPYREFPNQYIVRIDLKVK